MGGSLILALALVELTLEIVDLLILFKDRIQLVLLEATILLHLCLGATTLTTNLEQVSRVASLRRDGSGALDDLEYLRVDGDVQIVSIGQLLVASLDALANKLSERLTNDGVANV